MIVIQRNTSVHAGHKPLRYEPYISPCLGKSEITFHATTHGNTKPLFTEVSYKPSSVPDVSNISRENIKFKKISSDFIKNAKIVVSGLKAEWEKGKKLKQDFEIARDNYKNALSRFIRPNMGTLGGNPKVRYVDSPEKNALKQACDSARDACNNHPFSSPYSEKKSISNDNFLKAFHLVIEECSKKRAIPERLVRNKSFEALVTYLSVQTGLNQDGFLSGMPTGFYDYSDSDLISKVRTIGTYALVHQLKINTAKKAEDYNSFSSEDASRLGLEYLNHLITLEDLYKVCFPGYLEGGNPPIRPWLVSGTQKWQVADRREMHRVRLLATKAVKNVFEEQNVLNPDGSINLERLLEVNWGTVYHAELKGAIGICEYTPDSLTALEFAVPGIFETIPRFKFDYPGKWMGENAFSTIDAITHKVVEESNCLNPNGTLNVEAVRKVEDWAVQYNKQLNSCLGRSGIKTAYKALERVFPTQFGWGKDQIHPGEIRYGGMWDGKEGKRLFQLKLACSIYETFETLKKEEHEDFQNHTVVFKHELEYPLKMSKRDVQLFMSYLREYNKDWGDYIADHRLTAGLRDAASGSVEEALTVLFGKPKGKSKKLGDTELFVEDFSLSRNSIKQSEIIEFLSSEIIEEITDSQFSIKGFGKQDDYNGSDSINTGIAETCLEELFGKYPPSKIPEYIKVLYKAFSGAVLSYPSVNSFSTQSRQIALEKIAISKEFPPSNKPLLSERELKIFLKLIKEKILPNTSLSDQVKQRISEGFDKLINLRTRTRNKARSNRREIITELCYAVDLDKTTVFTVLSDVCEKLFNTMAIYEMRVFRKTGEYSPLFNESYVMASLEAD